MYLRFFLNFIFFLLSILKLIYYKMLNIYSIYLKSFLDRPIKKIKSKKNKLFSSKLWPTFQTKIQYYFLDLLLLFS